MPRDAVGCDCRCGVCLHSCDRAGTDGFQRLPAIAVRPVTLRTATVCAESVCAESVCAAGTLLKRHACATAGPTDSCRAAEILAWRPLVGQRLERQQRSGRRASCGVFAVPRPDAAVSPCRAAIPPCRAAISPCRAAISSRSAAVSASHAAISRLGSTESQPGRISPAVPAQVPDASSADATASAIQRSGQTASTDRSLFSAGGRSAAVGRWRRSDGGSQRG